MRSSRLSRLSSIAGVFTLLAVSTNVASAQNGNLIVQGVKFHNNSLTKVGQSYGTVTGTLAGSPFTTGIEGFLLTPGDNPATPLVVECAVLDLRLAPIHLALLGLHVDTSAICLQINAIPGGGLLGQLLCGLADGTIQLPLSAAQMSTLEGGLTTILHDALNRPPGQGSGGSVCTGQCEILELELGPLNLNLLGLEVILNNCTPNGPVEICISASRNEGILGQLLCGLTQVQLPNLSLADITQLLATATTLAADGSLSRRDIAILTQVLAQLISR